jgi:two-component system sensor kinase FixL
VLADHVQLEQVLANLIRNAIDAMAELAGERILRITAPGADGCVELAVADRGPGLAEAIRADPFAPFLTTKPDGVGLGLPICRTIVENHGGRLWVEHSSPAGTTFCFTLRPSPDEAVPTAAGSGGVELAGGLKWMIHWFAWLTTTMPSGSR